MKRLLLLVLLLITTLPTQAQVLRGRVFDAETRVTLPHATVHIAGTFRGTISNNDGAFELRAEALPVMLVVRYIGYRTDTLAVATESFLDVHLTPVAIELGAITVTDEDPAVRIMREVIERKSIWRETLESYSAQAYARTTLSNDSGIVAIMEGASTAWWDRERGLREIKRGSRQTGNVDFADDMPAAAMALNLYDDDIRVGGHRIIGVTHPDALSRYRFELIGERRLDDVTVYDIAVEPRNDLLMGFVGRVSVLDEAFAMIEVDLRPGRAFLHPLPIRRFEVAYQQQFSNYGTDAWLPVDLRSSSVFELGMPGVITFPTIYVGLVNRFTDYELNVPVPEELFASSDYMQVDSAAVESGEAFLEEGFTVPLTPPETLAYASIDSSMTLMKAYEPGGAIGRAIRRQQEIEERRDQAEGRFNFDFSRLPEPRVWYNRVDGLHGRLQLRRELGRRVTMSHGGGYSSGLSGANRWAYDTSVRLADSIKALGFVSLERTTWFFEVGYRAHTALRYESNFHYRFTNSVAMLLGDEDYFDYYRSVGPYTTASLKTGRLPTEIQVTWRGEEHTSLPLTTSYDLRGIKELQRDNVAIDEGRMHTLTVRIAVGERTDLLGITGARSLEVTSEHSLLGSDFRFRRHHATGHWRMTTFAERRFLPATLDLIGTVGFTSGSGRLPLQRVFVVEGGQSSYTPFGALRSLQGLPYEGRQMAHLVWEHNFRTIPFEILGMYGLAGKRLQSAHFWWPCVAVG